MMMSDGDCVDNCCDDNVCNGGDAENSNGNEIKLW